MPDYARSLVEAYVYLDITSPGAERAVTEQDDDWLVRAGDAEVVVPFVSEEEARLEDATFGLGLSELIDLGQWVLIAATYADRALEGGLLYSADTTVDERYHDVVADWRFAADAVAEALKFVRSDGTPPPPEAFWTDMGRAAYEDNPERFTYEALADDLAYYRDSLTNFQRLHQPPDQ
ncbi:hypothetical protein [Nonomuraea sp. NPDC003214]